VRNTAEVPLESGDVLIEINGRIVSRRVDMMRALSRDIVDQHIPLVIERNGTRQIVEVLAKAKASTRP
jgi:S1-C subfamily serine protease